MKEIEINGLYYTELKSTTKKAQELISNYENSGAETLYYVYGRPSGHKERAYENIKEEANKVGGYSIRITTYSKMYFTMAYKGNYNGCEYLVYHTPSYRYLIKLYDRAGRDPNTITPEEVKERVDNLNPDIRERLARSCPTLHTMEQVDQVLKISEAFSLMADLMKKDEK